MTDNTSMTRKEKCRPVPLGLVELTFGACEGKAIVVFDPGVWKLYALPIVVGQGKDGGKCDDATSKHLQDIAALQHLHMTAGHAGL